MVRVAEHPLQRQIADALRFEIAPPGKVSRDGVVWWNVDHASYADTAPGARRAWHRRRGRPTRAEQESGQETQLLGALPSARKTSMPVLLGTPRRHPRSRRGTSVAQSPHVLLRLSRRPIHRRLKDEFHNLLL